MTVKTPYFRGDIYKNYKNAELRCWPSPIGILTQCQLGKCVKLIASITGLSLDIFLAFGLGFSTEVSGTDTK